MKNDYVFYLNCTGIGEALSLYLFSDLLAKNPKIKLITNTNPLHPITRTANTELIKTAYEPLIKKGQVEIIMPLSKYYNNEVVACRNDSIEIVHNDKSPNIYWSELYNLVFTQFNPDVIFTWNRNIHLADQSIDRNKLIIHLEAGCFRWPPFYTVQFDPMGVNGYGLINQIDIDQIIPPSKKWYERKKIENVLCILQSDNDSNLKRFGKFKKSIGWIEFVRQYVPKNINVVFKGHPGLNVNSNAVQEIKNHCNIRKYKYIHDEHSIYDLFSEFDLVITQNSSVGFEAIYVGLPIITFCDSLYKPLLHEQEIENDFKTNLDIYYANQGRIKAFIYFCINRYMARGFNRQNDFSVFSEKILEKIDYYLSEFEWNLTQQQLTDFVKGLPKNEIIV